MLIYNKPPLPSTTKKINAKKREKWAKKKKKTKI
jgi:hypothetical protein